MTTPGSTAETSEEALQPAGLRTALHRNLWRAIRRLVGARGVLNATTIPSQPPRPDRELFRAAQEVKAVAVAAGGRKVDYAALAGSEAYRQLRRITRTLPTCRLEDLGDPSDRLAFWINLYNALVLDGVLHFEIEGRMDPRFFQRAAYNVCGHRFSADDIEHGVLRGNRPHPLFRLVPFPAGDPRRRTTITPFNPRVHFALNCGARSCPPIAFYEGESIDQQLEVATASFLRGGGAEIDMEHNRLHLSRIFRWYQSDFGGRRGVLSLVAEHVEAEDEAKAVRSGALTVEYQSYDWTVNRIL